MKQCLLTAVLWFCGTASAGILVDLNVDNDRNDTDTPRAINWAVREGASSSLTIGGLSATLHADGGRLSAALWKGGLDTGATLSCDGVTSDGPITLVLNGLAAGTHTLSTFHNELNRNDVPKPMIVTVVGAQRSVTATRRATADEDAGHAFLSFDARAGEPVEIRIEPSPGGQVVLNGFEIDGVDPSLRIRRISPANGDEHHLSDAPLAWTEPAATIDGVRYDLYQGTNAEAVASATRDSSEFKATLDSTTYTPAGLNAWHDYYWRVDVVDEKRGTTTRGEVNHFRIARVAFPGAEGYGRFARGGRGGRVIEVTNLNDAGPGSLREACDAEGPRTVVFRVGGVIRLKSKLVIRNPYCTIAGQTAPGDGICLYGATFAPYATHDVIIRHVRIRIGDESGVTQDGTGFASCDHVIMDHCSVAWSIDEAVSSRGAKNITFQRSLITEPLNMSIHSHYVGTGKGHSFAGSISGNVGSFHHNLIANAAGRNWSLAGGLTQGGKFAGYLDLRNNVVYNFAHRTNDGGVRKANLVNNLYLPGPATKVDHLLIAMMELRLPDDVQQYYVAGNRMEGFPQYDADNWQNGGVRVSPQDIGVMKLDQPFCESFVTTQSAADAYESVLADVGANIPRSDPIDRRAIDNTLKRTTTFKGSKTGTPGIIDSQADAGGLPEYAGGEPPIDSDHDGMPDTWETTRGLNPNDAGDGNAIGKDDYTNLELYLNDIVEQAKK